MVRRTSNDTPAVPASASIACDALPSLSVEDRGASFFAYTCSFLYTVCHIRVINRHSFIRLIYNYILFVYCCFTDV